MLRRKHQPVVAPVKSNYKQISLYGIFTKAPEHKKELLKFKKPPPVVITRPPPEFLPGTSTETRGIRSSEPFTRPALGPSGLRRIKVLPQRTSSSSSSSSSSESPESSSLLESSSLERSSSLPRSPESSSLLESSSSSNSPELTLKDLQTSERQLSKEEESGEEEEESGEEEEESGEEEEESGEEKEESVEEEEEHAPAPASTEAKFTVAETRTETEAKPIVAETRTATESKPIVAEPLTGTRTESAAKPLVEPLTETRTESAAKSTVSAEPLTKTRTESAAKSTVSAEALPVTTESKPVAQKSTTVATEASAASVAPELGPLEDPIKKKTLGASPGITITSRKKTVKSLPIEKEKEVKAENFEVKENKPIASSFFPISTPKPSLPNVSTPPSNTQKNLETATPADIMTDLLNTPKATNTSSTLKKEKHANTPPKKSILKKTSRISPHLTIEATNQSAENLSVTAKAILNRKSPLIESMTNLLESSEGSSASSEGSSASSKGSSASVNTPTSAVSAKTPTVNIPTPAVPAKTPAVSSNRPSNVATPKTSPPAGAEKQSIVLMVENPSEEKEKSATSSSKSLPPNVEVVPMAPSSPDVTSANKNKQKGKPLTPISESQVKGATNEELAALESTITNPFEVNKGVVKDIKNVEKEQEEIDKLISLYEERKKLAKETKELLIEKKEIETIPNWNENMDYKNDLQKKTKLIRENMRKIRKIEAIINPILSKTNQPTITGISRTLKKPKTKKTGEPILEEDQLKIAKQQLEKAKNKIESYIPIFTDINSDPKKKKDAKDKIQKYTRIQQKLIIDIKNLEQIIQEKNALFGLTN